MKVEYLSVLQVDREEGLHIPEKFPYPYTPEKFTQEEEAVLKTFFTNTDKPVFAVKNLPQEVVGALFSRYSRSALSVRRTFLKEFWSNKDLGIRNVSEHLVDEGDDLEKARARSKKFFEIVFAEYGDDSVIQMGSPHIAFEFVSQIAAKEIEDGRIATAYIEKSTRYVDFDEEINGRFLFMEPPEIEESEFHDEFNEWNNALFETYKKHIPTTKEYLRHEYPIENQVFVDKKTEKEVLFKELKDEKDIDRASVAYEKALRAKALDTIRVFLPTTTVTNLGAHFSGQAAEHAINKMLSSEHGEVRLLGTMALQELFKVTPSFLQNVDNHHGRITRKYLAEMKPSFREVTNKWINEVGHLPYRNEVRLVDWDEDADIRIASQILFEGQETPNRTKREIFEWARDVKKREILEKPSLTYSPTLTQIITEAIPDRKAFGRNRRHKLPRAFEHASAEFECFLGWAEYRDLQRNRMQTQARQPLSAEVAKPPREFFGRGMEQVLSDFYKLSKWTKTLHRRMLASDNAKVKKAAEYVTIFGNSVRFNIRLSTRQGAFFPELRTISGGHPLYRRAVHKFAAQYFLVYPFLKDLTPHIDWKRDYGLGRLKAEIRTQEKLSKLTEAEGK